jgi:hypothetical protein
MTKKYVDGVLTDASMWDNEQALKDADAQPSPDLISAKHYRAERDMRLRETDWMALSDNTMTPEWASYRQALRDITEQTGFPYSVEWPTKP